MTPVEACKALNENSVSAVRRLAEHMGVDPVGLSGRLDLVALVNSLDETLGLIRKAQERLCEYLRPDGSNDDRVAMNDLLYMFDGPEQRAIEKPARAALSSLRGDQ